MDGDMYNIYTDESGEQQSKLMGNMGDLRTIKVKEVGGVPIEKLQAHYDIQRDRAGKKDTGMPNFILGFPDDRQVPIPTSAITVQKARQIACYVLCAGRDPLCCSLSSRLRLIAAYCAYALFKTNNQSQRAI